MKLRELILSQFEPDVAVALIEFGKSLSKMDADAFMFLARKSLCLYDVLVKIGVPPVEKCVVSDRILDMRLDPLNGKRVVLVDDTLIVGTTIAKTQAILENTARAKVTTKVFCIDSDWYCKNLTIPDEVSLRLNDARVMSFCSAEVRAMSLVPRPYLVDFPISTCVRLKQEDAEFLLSSTGWHGTRISTELQQRHGVDVLTYFPTDWMVYKLKKIFGDQIFACVDLLKVRLFARKYLDIYQIQIVPIVTLKPLYEQGVLQLLKQLCIRLAPATGVDFTKLAHYAITPISQQRLAQYILSIALGHTFLNHLELSIDKSIHKKFDDFEAARHYGPWLQEEISKINKAACEAFQPQKPLKPTAKIALPKLFPKKVNRWSREMLALIARDRIVARKRAHVDTPPNLLGDFAGIFLKMYEVREIPAREEARRLGKAFFDKSQTTSARNRLESGIPWNRLVEWITRQYGVDQTAKVKNVLSIVLDICNDFGISVPITCVQDGIVFRAYRHGEDVRFADKELALVYHLVKGYLEGAGRTDVPRLVLEKIIVLLFRIGVARKILEPFYGTSGTDGIGKIKFDLKGARPIIERGPRDSADHNLWLTDHLVARRIVNEKNPEGKKTKGRYTLGIVPEGNFDVVHAPDDVWELGNLVGVLMTPISGLELVPPLDSTGLTILATCPTPHHTASALLAELDIFQDSYETYVRAALSKINWGDPDSIASCYKELLNSHGHEAVYSARLKYISHIEDRCAKIIKNCIEYLNRGYKSPLLARKWSSYWSSFANSQPEGELRKFAPDLNRMAILFWELSALFSAIEIALTYRLAALKTRQFEPKLANAFAKLRRYRSEMIKSGLEEPKIVTQICERFEEIGALRQTEFFLKDDEFVLRRITVAEKEHPGFDPILAVQYAQDQIEKRIPDLKRLVNLLDGQFQSYGKTGNRHYYKYMLYYDIIDSTATVVGRTGADVQEYRGRVRQFKEHVNDWFIRSGLLAKKKNAEIFCQNGNRSSTNDCKHVFYSGQLGRRYVEETVKMLIEDANSFGDIRVRVGIIPCNFVGSTAFRERNALDPEVQGESFWEHYSRLQKATDNLEKQKARKHSLLSIATEELFNELQLPISWKWQPESQPLTSEIALLTKNTLVYFGEVNCGK
jgi:hypoxanthine phosphoribosyltransferase